MKLKNTKIFEINGLNGTSIVFADHIQCIEIPSDIYSAESGNNE